MKIATIDLLEEYEKSSKIENRMVGVGININGSDIEYQFFPEKSELKLIMPEIEKMVVIAADYGEIGIDSKDTEEEIQDKISSYVKRQTLNKDFPLDAVVFADDGREFLRKGFIHVPSRFLFNDQRTTDNIVVTENEDGQKGILLIDRKLPPTGWAMAGGMVDEAALEKAAMLGVDANEQNAADELEEELGLKNVSVVDLEDGYETYSSYEVRGSMTTHITVFDSPMALKDKMAIAGDDASDFEFLTMDEIKELLVMGNYVKNGKVINLIPHHRKILKKILNPFSLKKNKELFESLSKDNEMDKSKRTVKGETYVAKERNP